MEHCLFSLNLDNFVFSYFDRMQISVNFSRELQIVGCQSDSVELRKEVGALNSMQTLKEFLENSVCKMWGFFPL